MRSIIAGSAALVCIQMGAALAQDSCPDPWAKLQGTYRCQGSCNYTASVCNLPEYSEGIKRWRFINGQGGSTTGIFVVTGAKTIAFSTSDKWTFNKASTPDCGDTLRLEAGPDVVEWKRIDDNPRACGGQPRKRAR
jgi:hypothetical protein